MSGSRDWNNLDREGQRNASVKDSRRNLQQMLRRQYQQSRGSPESGSNRENISPVQEPVSFRPPTRQEEKKINITPPGSGASGRSESPEPNGNFVFENNFETPSQNEDVAVTQKGQGQMPGKNHTQSQGQTPSKCQRSSQGQMNSKGYSQGQIPKKDQSQGQMNHKGEVRKQRRQTDGGQFDDALNTVIGEISSSSGQGARSRQEKRGEKAVIFENNFDDVEQSTGRADGANQHPYRGDSSPNPYNMNRTREQITKEKAERLQRLRQPRQGTHASNDPFAMLSSQLGPNTSQTENKDEDGDERMDDLFKPMGTNNNGSDGHDQGNSVLQALKNQVDGKEKGDDPMAELLESFGMAGADGGNSLNQMMETFGSKMEENGGIGEKRVGEDSFSQLMRGPGGIGIGDSGQVVVGGQNGMSRGQGGAGMSQMGGGRGTGGGVQGAIDPMSQMMGALGGMGGGGADLMSQMMATLGGGGGGGADMMSQMMATLGGEGGGGADMMSQMMRQGGGRGGGPADPLSSMMGALGGGQGQGQSQQNQFAMFQQQQVSVMRGQGRGERGGEQAGGQFEDEEIDINNVTLNDQLQQLLGYENIKAQTNRSPISSGMCTIIILDTSGSMQGDPITEAGQFISQFLNGLEEVQFEYEQEENVAVICVGREVHVLHHLTTDYSAVRQAVDSVYADGPSPLHLALMLPLSVLVLDPRQNRDYIANTNGHRIRPRVIVITDGRPSEKEDIPGPSYGEHQQDSFDMQSVCVEMIQTVRERTLCELYCIPVGDSNINFLSALCESVGGSIKQTTDAKQMSRTFLHHFVVGNLIKSGHDTTNREVVAQVVQQCLACSDQEDVTSVMKILAQGEPDVSVRDQAQMQQANPQGRGRGGGKEMGQQQSMPIGSGRGEGMGRARGHPASGQGHPPFVGGDGDRMEPMIQSLMASGRQGGVGQGEMFIPGMGQRGGQRGKLAELGSSRGGRYSMHASKRFNPNNDGGQMAGRGEQIFHKTNADNNKEAGNLNDQRQWKTNVDHTVSKELVDSLMPNSSKDSADNYMKQFMKSRPPPQTEEEKSQYQFDQVMNADSIGINEPYDYEEAEIYNDDVVDVSDRKTDAAEEDIMQLLNKDAKERTFANGGQGRVPFSHDPPNYKPSQGHQKTMYQTDTSEMGSLDGLGLVNVEDDDVDEVSRSFDQSRRRNSPPDTSQYKKTTENTSDGSRRPGRPPANRESLRNLLQQRHQRTARQPRQEPIQRQTYPNREDSDTD